MPKKASNKPEGLVQGTVRWPNRITPISEAKSEAELKKLSARLDTRIRFNIAALSPQEEWQPVETAEVSFGEMVSSQPFPGYVEVTYCLRGLPFDCALFIGAEPNGDWTKGAFYRGGKALDPPTLTKKQPEVHGVDFVLMEGEPFKEAKHI